MSDISAKASGLSFSRVVAYFRSGDWTKFEIAWLVTATAIITTLGFMWDDTLIGFISSISGILCVIMAAKGKIATYYFGIVQASTYAYISYSYGLYGEAMLNGLFFLPIQFIGIWLWMKHRKTKNVIHGEDVYMNTLSRKQWSILIPVILAATAGYFWVLVVIDANQPGLDSFAVVLSVFAQLLMVYRYVEQWVLWIVINIITISLWFLVLTQQGGNDWTIFAMWVAFLANSVYGYINWRKIANREKAVSSKEESATSQKLG